MWPLFPTMLLRGSASPFLRKPLTSESFTTKAQRSRQGSQTFMVARLDSKQFCKGRRNQGKKRSSLNVAVLLQFKGRHSTSSAGQISSDQATPTWQVSPLCGLWTQQRGPTL